VLTDYSIGKDIDFIAANVCELLGVTYPKYLNDFPPGDPAEGALRPPHSEMLRYFSALILSNPTTEQATNFVSSYDVWDYQGPPVPIERDVICEAFVTYLTGEQNRLGGTGVNWPEAYAPLYDAIAVDTPVSDRAAHIEKFLNGWYKNMATDLAAQTDRHNDKICTHVGYWCLEAAAAVIYAKIDDTSFRDHVHYPKDWVDWAKGT
jgi:hypothetical protein